MNKHAAPDLKADKIARRRRAPTSATIPRTSMSPARPSISTTCRSRPARCTAASASATRRARPASRRIDLSAVRAAPGVVDVLTAADVPGENDISADRPPRRAGACRRQGRVLRPADLLPSSPRRASRRAAPPAGQGRLRGTAARHRHRRARSRQGQARHAAADAEARRRRRGDRRGAAPARRARCAIGGQEHFYLEGQSPWPCPARTTTSPSIPRPSIRAKSSTWSAHALGVPSQRRHGRDPPHGRRLRRQGDAGQPVRRARRDRRQEASAARSRSAPTATTT